ncbi:hypothetical protein J7U46_03435 [Pelomonas sp. V22]|uniref:post-PEP-CTERM-1 domain-containing protein n=1 Tax=Pelomonas sp. V22 TaxID=2822139 RepID=UPI0024A7DDB2|nr:hypothetical protein [Pelomonas sp. V22]MDI4632092.1 hypothetical protein [Pelomonas sp. V22]
MFKRIKTSRTEGQQALRVGLAAAAAVIAFAATPLAQAADAKAGLRVAKDPVTGELRALTSTEAAELDAAAAKAKASANAGKRKAATAVTQQEIQHADGTVEMPLDESSHMYSVAVRRADGSVEYQCVHGKPAVDAILKGKKPASSKAVKAHQEHGYELK